MPIKQSCDNKDGSNLSGASSNAMVGTMIFVIVLIVIVAGVIGYKWHLKSKEKQNILNKWKMAYPKTTVDNWLTKRVCPDE